MNHLGMLLKYSQPLNSMYLNREGPLTWEFFSIVNTTVLYNPWLVESEDAELCSGGSTNMEG